jgi:hypothetical protein
MNERIKQLAEQAGFDIEVEDIFNYEPQHSFIGSDENMKKFAELIVKECAGLVEDYYDEDTKYLAGHIIRKHFGVK